ncbi:HEPN domain-containing protein [Methylobacterium sp. EM32]|uniref:HEPN domain-containing protein n=1 Tax=Methylobacterium sp. EM32 TaxID=3163481 RepID=UPI0033BF31E9
MSADKATTALLRIATADLADARVLANMRSRNAPYLCSQAAEKIVKAVLTAEGIHANRNVAHRIDLMVDLLPDANGFKPRFRKIEGLTSYATSYRYPTPTGRVPTAPSPDKLARLIDETGDLLRDVADRFGIDLT